METSLPRRILPRVASNITFRGKGHGESKSVFPPPVQRGVLLLKQREFFVCIIAISLLYIKSSEINDFRAFWSECNYSIWKNPVIPMVLAQQARDFYPFRLYSLKCLQLLLDVDSVRPLFYTFTLVIY